jgi:sugar lactone lactonase YvrE
VSERWEVVLAAGAELGERPVWEPAARSLIWVDILAGQVHRYSPGAGRDQVVIDLGPGVPVGAAAPRRRGGYVLAAADGFRLTGAGEAGGSGSGQAGGRAGTGPVRPPGMGADLRFNDGAVDPAGRFWAGTVARDRRPGAGALYRLDGDGTITVMLGAVTESNGIGWSPAADAMYFIDSGEPEPRVRVFGYDLASGAIGAGADLITFGPADGTPDGLAVDAQGGLWIAMWGAFQVRRYSPAGELLDTVILPVSCPTCPGFGGDGLDELYVTSAWENMDTAGRAAEPLAGHIFRIASAGATGQPASRYAG